MPHSALICNSLIIGHHFSASAFTSAPSASGVCRSRRKNLKPEIGEPRPHRRIGQCFDGRHIELADDVLQHACLGAKARTRRTR